MPGRGWCGVSKEAALYGRGGEGFRWKLGASLRLDMEQQMRIGLMCRLKWTALVIGSFMLVGCGSQASREARYIERGEAYLAQGQFVKARIEFRNAGRLVPTDPRVPYLIGLVAEREGDLRGAFGAYRAAVTQSPQFAPALLKLAQYYIEAGQLDKATACVHQVLAKAPGDAQGLALEGSLALHMQHAAKALALARQALSHAPDNATAIAVEVGAEVALGQLRNAEAHARAGLGRHPDSVELARLEIAVFEKAGETADALAGYQRLLDRDPRDGALRREFVQTCAAAGRLDFAEATLRAESKRFPRDVSVTAGLIDFLNRFQGAAAAEAEVRKRIATSPGNVADGFLLAELEINHGQLDEAVAVLKQIAQQQGYSPDGLNALTALANIDWARDDQPATAALVHTVLAHAPDNPQAMYLQAAMAFRAGRLQSAVDDLRGVLAQRSQEPKALALLAEVLVRQGHLDLAVQTLEQLVASQPTDWHARVRLAQLAHLSGDESIATSELGKVTKAQPGYAPAWETLARIAIEAHDSDAATKAIARLEALPGQAELAKVLAAQLALVDGQTLTGESALMSVISQDPTSPLAKNALALLVASTSSRDALAQLRSFLLSLGSRDADIQTVLAECDIALHDTNDAATVLDAVIAMHPSDPRPYLERARLQLAAGRPEQAVTLLRTAATLDHTDDRADLMLATVLQQQGDIAEVQAIYQRLLNRDPGLDDVANNLAELIADTEYDKPAALANARYIAERFIDSPDPRKQDTLAWVYFRLGKIDRAMTIAEKLLPQHGLAPQVHYHLAMILRAAGQEAEARAQLRQAVTGSGQAAYPGLNQARQWLDKD